MRAGDGDATRRLAHALRGLAGNFALTALVPALEAMERAAQSRDPVAMHAALEGFEAEFEHALRQLGSAAA